MKILITGGCGFLGSNLAEYAVKSGHEVALFDNLCREGSVSNLRWLKGLRDFRFVHGDIRSRDEVASVVENFKPQAVFHLAGQVAMTTSIASPRTDFEVNVLGAVNLLEAVRRHSPDAAIIYSSTNKVYGDLEQYSYRASKTRYICVDKPEGFNEATPLEFHSPYGCSKGAADQYMLDYARIFGLKTVVFRHSSMYGGRQFATYDQGWIGWFCQKALEQKRGQTKNFTISGDGKQVRDVLHAEDMQRLYFSALKNISKVRGRAFNIGGGMANSLSLLELFSMLREKIGVALKYVELPVRASDQKVFVADISKITAMTGWAPKVGKDAGIGKMIEWVKNGK